MPRDLKHDTRPATKTHVDLKEMKDIVGKAMRHPDLRKKLLDDPAKTLEEMNYHPDPGAIEFLKQLKASGFHEAADKFKPHDPHYGMAEG